MSTPKLSTRERLAHLYRRFGLGATPWELDEAEKLGYDRALSHLLDYDEVEDPSEAVSPFEFCWRDKEDPDTGSWRFRTWWILRMLTTTRPAKEKLALFWHSHFAVGDDKVENGAMMLDYLQVLRQNGSGKFSTLLEAVAKSPAMMRYLDMQRSLRGRPNENFAREVMELFTLGIGNYTEDDVKAVSRALTGWGYVDTYYEMGGTATDRLKEAIRDDRPFSSFAYMPPMHDPSSKTILGKTAHWNGDGVIQALAEHPATAHHLARKLWSFYAYADPEPAVVERIASAFHKSGGNIAHALMTIAKSPEFWSEKCVRRMAKSPLDYTLGIARAQGLGGALASERKPDADVYTEMPQNVLNECGNLSFQMERQGLMLLNPPDVSGWRWGDAWITPAAMAYRYRYRGNMYWGQKGPGACGKYIYEYVKGRNPKNPEEIVDAICDLHDIPLAPEKRKVVAKLFGNGTESLAKVDAFMGANWRAMGLLFAAPEAHIV
ncbi:hypothetical protein BH11ARM2_BH11ARM2_33610 [soil metagenome]